MVAKTTVAVSKWLHPVMSLFAFSQLKANANQATQDFYVMPGLPQTLAVLIFNTDSSSYPGTLILSLKSKKIAVFLLVS